MIEMYYGNIDVETRMPTEAEMAKARRLSGCELTTAVDVEPEATWLVDPVKMCMVCEGELTEDHVVGELVELYKHTSDDVE